MSRLGSLAAALSCCVLALPACKSAEQPSKVEDAKAGSRGNGKGKGGPGATHGAAKGPREPGDPVYFLSLSDIHLDPFTSPDLFLELQAAPATQWRAIFEAAPEKDRTLDASSRGHDTSFAIFDSTLGSLAAQVAGPKKPAFVIISGDFLGHHYRELFTAALEASGTEMAKGDAEVAFQGFVDKTLAFVTQELDAALGGVPVFPAIGNNDAYCGDYALAPAGPFLERTAALWGPLVERATSTDFAETFPAGGYYSALVPGVEGLRVVVLDTVFFSNQYENRCAVEGGPLDPSEDQFEWLSSTLSKAKAADERVWLVYHIPPGINVYPSAHPKPDTACADNTQMFWDLGRSRAFINLVDRYGEIIEANFAGHIHTDDFRLRMIGRAATEFIHFTPAVSPLFGNNPGYQRFRADSGTAQVEDYTTLFLDLASEEPTWAEEYTFSQSYGQPRYDLAALVATRAAIRDDPAVRAKYEQYYAVGNVAAKQLTPDNWRAYWCATAELSVERYDACYCETDQP